MSTRRRFLTWLGMSLTSAPLLFARDETARRSRWEMMLYNEEPGNPLFRPDPSSWDNSTITAAWIGHATVLINFYGTWIITDPVFSERIGIDAFRLFTIGPRRLVRPALRFEEISPIDLILVSHGHMDHMDTPTLRKFERTTPIVIAKHTLDIIENYGFQEIYELDWGEYSLIRDVRIEALEVKHFGWRYPWEEDRSRGNPEGRSYNAYLISKGGHHILFGGDTAFHEKFLGLAERKLNIELAIMPIGAYNPWIRNHASPEQSLDMVKQMGAPAMLPMHWRTFIQSDEPVEEPMERLKIAAADQPEMIALERIGHTWRRRG